VGVDCGKSKQQRINMHVRYGCEPILSALLRERRGERRKKKKEKRFATT
jgi:hypothetical protein